MVQMHYDICETESMNTVTVQVTVRSQPRLSVSRIHAAHKTRGNATRGQALLRLYQNPK